MAARAVGATTIVAIDIVPSRLEMAKELGATHVINTQLERFFAAKIARIEAPASEDAGKPIAWKVPPFQPIE
jgi:threonine dehydrogenase-like Zn-dependent dehydrogenase